MTDRAEVLDAGAGEQFGIFKGDVVGTNRIDEVNKKIKKKGGRLIEYKPTLLSIRVSPYHSKDFVGKLMFERLHETIAAAPRIGATADTRTGHPITQYVFGRSTGAKT
jgi:nucleoside diphosphate kinase